MCLEAKKKNSFKYIIIVLLVVSNYNSEINSN